MTREEKLYSMTMKMLVIEAEKAGVKINKKGKKEDAVNKILEAEREEETMNTTIEKIDLNDEMQTRYLDLEATFVNEVEKPVIVDDKEAPQEVTEPVAEKPEKKVDRFTDLLQLVPTAVNADVTCKSVQGNTVSVKLGAARIFRLAGNGKHFELFTDRDLVGTLFEMILAGELDGSGIGYGGDTDGAPSELTVQHYVKGNRRSYGIIKLSKEQVVDIMTQILEII